MNEIKIQLTLMENIVLGNLNQCCKELLEWNATGLLPDGKVREAARQLTDKVFEGRQLVHVENFVKSSAMECVVQLNEK